MQGLSVKEMEELRDDIKMHLDLDRATPTHIEFWEVLSVSFPFSGFLPLTVFFVDTLPPVMGASDYSKSC